MFYIAYYCAGDKKKALKNSLKFVILTPNACFFLSKITQQVKMNVDKKLHLKVIRC